MTDYPSIKPEDVREGDVVQLRHGAHRGFAVTEGTVWRTQHGNLLVGNSLISKARDLRLVSRPTPPEPPLRVGDWVRDNVEEGQITKMIGDGSTNPHIWFGKGRASTGEWVTRIEPPVGWPVGVPTIDAPTVWYFKSTSSGKYVWCGDVEIDFSWSELVAAGGVPALAVTR